MTRKWFETRSRLDVADQLASEHSHGNNGCFLIKRKGGSRYFCIAEDTGGWEHVSVSLRRGDLSSTGKIPTWEDMCRIKRLFWDPTDTVVQYHPPESDYVNIHNATLHLWRPSDGVFAMPPVELV